MSSVDWSLYPQDLTEGMKRKIRSDPTKFSPNLVIPMMDLHRKGRSPYRGPATGYLWHQKEEAKMWGPKKAELSEFMNGTTPGVGVRTSSTKSSAKPSQSSSVGSQNAYDNIQAGSISDAGIIGFDIYDNKARGGSKSRLVLMNGPIFQASTSYFADNVNVSRVRRYDVSKEEAVTTDGIEILLRAMLGEDISERLNTFERVLNYNLAVRFFRATTLMNDSINKLAIFVADLKIAYQSIVRFERGCDIAEALEKGDGCSSLTQVMAWGAARTLITHHRTTADWEKIIKMKVSPLRKRMIQDVGRYFQDMESGKISPNQPLHFSEDKTKEEVAALKRVNQQGNKKAGDKQVAQKQGLDKKGKARKPPARSSKNDLTNHVAVAPRKQKSVPRRTAKTAKTIIDTVRTAQKVLEDESDHTKAKKNTKTVKESQCTPKVVSGDDKAAKDGESSTTSIEKNVAKDSVASEGEEDHAASRMASKGVNNRRAKRLIESENEEEDEVVKEPIRKGKKRRIISDDEDEAYDTRARRLEV